MSESIRGELVFLTIKGDAKRKFNQGLEGNQVYMAAAAKKGERQAYKMRSTFPGGKDREFVLGRKMSYIIQLDLGFMSNNLKANKTHFRIHKMPIYKCKMFCKNYINKLEPFTYKGKREIMVLNEIYIDSYNWDIYTKG